MFTDKQLISVLEKSEQLSPTELKKHIQSAKNARRKLEEYLLDKKIFSSESLYETAAQVYRVPFVKMRGQPIRKDILFLIPEPLARRYEVVAYDKNGSDQLKILTTDPQNLQAFELLRKKTGKELDVSMTTPEELQDLMKQYHKSLEAEFQDIAKKGADGEKGLEELAEDLPVIRVVDTILEYAIFENASDIHIEPADQELAVRYRIDGVLKNVMTLPMSIHAGVVARIKVLSSLKLDEHRLPQDGRFKIQTKEHKIAFRVSILPTFNGEKLVLRLLNEGAEAMSLDQLGMQTKALEILKRNIERPHGMILVTGPTGSGKTTTLYTVLSVLNTPEVNISTVEDPVEYRMEHINQSQVNSKIGFTFAMGLRALLRQDPNIIMVGEIRDEETAEIAVNAAMTGHLLLSTLHTNDAVTAIPRLYDMGIPPFLVASTTNIVMAQRLVRKICPHCIVSYNLDKAAIDELTKQFDVAQVLTTMKTEGAISNKTESLDKLLFYRGKGCKQCGDEGYKGRIGIYEVLEVDKDVQEAILRKASREDLIAIADKQNMMTMMEDGFLKAKAGITTIEEVLRVTQE